MQKQAFTFRSVALGVGVISSAATQIILAADNAKSAKPNIVFIIADDMGYGDLACYGNKVVKTPNIDQLARDGVRFTQAYAGSAVSSPSRCCLLTGMNSGHSRIRDNFAKTGGIVGDKNGTPIHRANLLETDTTLALMLHGVGYHSILINKWHQDGFNPTAGPLDRGFDEFKGWLINNPESNLPYYYPAKRFNNRQLVDVPENQNGIQGKHNNDISTDEAIQFIGENKHKPFFLYLAYDTPHEPYVIRDLGIYKDSKLSLTAKTYAALITHMDDNVGRVLKALDAHGLRENTVVVFISDNGGAVMAPREELKCNANLRGLKGNLYEGGIRVPVIARWPHHFAKGKISNALTYFPDFMPTLAQITGAKATQHIDGISILPTLKGKNQDTENRFLYWEFPNQSQAVRWGKWKAIRTAWSKALELYDLDTDLSETTDVAKQNPNVISTIENYLKTARTESEYWPTDIQ
jgi:arylsulfatase A-like enzyme